MPGIRAVFGEGDLPELHQTMTPVVEQPDIKVRMTIPLALTEIRCAGEEYRAHLARVQGERALFSAGSRTRRPGDSMRPLGV